MSKSIIEKFGLAPTPWVIKGGYIEDTFILDANGNRLFQTDFSAVYEDDLVIAAPAMLEALIKCVLSEESLHISGDLGDYDINSDFYTNAVKAIEKATGKTWEEIKELINE